MMGHGAVHEFAGKWPELAEVCLRSVLELNRIQESVRPDELARRAAANQNCIVAAVADPGAVDCPLVFISESFAEMTGYGTDFALGRNCRFLQPNDREMNSRLNGDEVQRMKAFCVGQHAAGETILNLLVNEHRQGGRFWNLLHMTHVVVSGRKYILAVQTNLDLPMPRIIKFRDCHHVDGEEVDIFARILGDFLQSLRVQLRAGADQGVSGCATLALKEILVFLKQACDDYADDYAG